LPLREREEVQAVPWEVGSGLLAFGFWQVLSRFFRDGNWQSEFTDKLIVSLCEIKNLSFAAEFNKNSTMKNLSLILNIVLLAAVAYLFFDKFSGPKKPVNSEGTDLVDSNGVVKPLSIVYVNIDSLHERSTAYQAIKKQLEKKYADTEASLKAKQAAFEKEYKEYMAKGQSGTITPNEAQKYEESLGKKQQAMQVQEEKASLELKKQTDNFDEKFVGDIKHFADSLRQANGYDYVLLHGGLVSPMLSANEGLDITQVIVDLLNAKK
jgi:outer membrane protein